MRYLLLCLLLLAPWAANAQLPSKPFVTIEGRVTRVNGDRVRPLVGATVRTRCAQYSHSHYAVTGSEGYFALTLPATEMPIVLITDYAGYQPVWTPVAEEYEYPMIDLLPAPRWRRPARGAAPESAPKTLSVP